MVSGAAKLLIFSLTVKELLVSLLCAKSATDWKTATLGLTALRQGGCLDEGLMPEV
jgi:hypothetical protein